MCVFVFYIISSNTYLLNSCYFYGMRFHRTVPPVSFHVADVDTSEGHLLVISLLPFLIHGLSLAATKLHSIWSVYLCSYLRIHGVAVTTRENVWVRVYVQFLVWHVKRSKAGIRKSVRLSVQRFDGCWVCYR